MYKINTFFNSVQQFIKPALFEYDSIEFYEQTRNPLI